MPDNRPTPQEIAYHAAQHKLYRAVREELGDVPASVVRDYFRVAQAERGWAVPDAA